MVTIVLAMLVIAAGALLINHYAFSNARIALPTTTTIAPQTQALRSCEADGATVSTAMAAFSAQNPGVTVTQSDLTGSAYGGPYIESWPYYPGFYEYSLLGGILYVQSAVKGSTPIDFNGPETCAQIGL
jgi:hypothetical protein